MGHAKWSQTIQSISIFERRYSHKILKTKKEGKKRKKKKPLTTGKRVTLVSNRVISNSGTTWLFKLDILQEGLDPLTFNTQSHIHFRNIAAFAHSLQSYPHSFKQSITTRFCFHPQTAIWTGMQKQIPIYQSISCIWSISALLKTYRERLGIFKSWRCCSAVFLSFAYSVCLAIEICRRKKNYILRSFQIL